MVLNVKRTGALYPPNFRYLNFHHKEIRPVSPSPPPFTLDGPYHDAKIERRPIVMGSLHRAIQPHRQDIALELIQTPLRSVDQRFVAPEVSMIT